MDSKYSRRASMDCSNEDVCMQGFFIKSPPLHLFNNQSSWKRRHFVLYKSSNGYLLKYHKGQHKKGCIEINKDSKIEIGIDDSERMTAVKRMFKCQHSEVMTIKTEERAYYLIGTDSKDIEEWANFFCADCKEKETNALETQNQIPIQSRSRSQSSPANLTEYWADLHEGNEYEEISDDKKRPYSEPYEESPIYESLRKLVPCQRGLPSHHCVPEEQTKGKHEKEEESEQPYYDTPRRILAELDRVIAEHSNPVENLSPNDTDCSQNRMYMSMKNVVIKGKIQPACTSVELETLPRNQENYTDLNGGMGIQPLNEGNTRAKELLPENKAKRLTVVQLSKLLNSKIIDDSQLEVVDIHLPQNEAINCLSFTEAIGRICVSQWKGPHHLNCIFHHGDHITAVNDLYVTSTDEVLLFIKRATRKEVKLTVCRLPDSEIFHTEGCMCKKKEQGKKN